MQNIKILIVGRSDWIDNLNDELKNRMQQMYSVEIITDKDAAIKRLTHNSYNILLIQNKFSNTDPISLASLAYAMTRPSIILCASFLEYAKYKIWHYISKFSRKFKTSKKLINFNYNFKNLEQQIVLLTKDYMKYFDEVNLEVKNNTL